MDSETATSEIGKELQHTIVAVSQVYRQQEYSLVRATFRGRSLWEAAYIAASVFERLHAAPSTTENTCAYEFLGRLLAWAESDDEERRRRRRRRSAGRS